VLLWDVTDPGRPYRLDDPLTGHTQPVAFAPDGHTLAAASADRTVLLIEPDVRLTDRLLTSGSVPVAVAGARP